MSSSTANLHLTKLSQKEKFSNAVLNDNLGKIDKFAGDVAVGFVKAPFAEGGMGQVLRTNGAGLRYWDNDASSAVIATQTDKWLEQHITNPDSPPLDRSLTQKNAAAPADLLGGIRDDIGNLLVEYTKHVYANPRQLFDKRILPDLTGNNLHTNTSTRAITTYPTARIYVIEVNGHTGDLFTFNLLNSKTFADYSISSMEIYAIDMLPQNGGTALQRGSSSSSNYRGTITLAQNAKYIYIDIASNATGEEAITAACNGAMENTVVRKGDYGTTYYEYSELTDYDASYKVVPIVQGRENAGKTLKIDPDGNVGAVTVIDASAEIEETQGIIDDYLLHVDKTYTVNPRQLFDKSTLPDITGNHLATNTSTRVISASTRARVYVVEINGELGETYSYNLLNSKTFAEYHISSMEIFATDNYPFAGMTAQQRGSSSSTYYRGSIILGQNSKYIYLNIFMNSDLSDETEITNACNSAMENVVIRKGNNDNTYYDYTEDVTITPTYRVVKIDQGIENAGRMLIIGGDGKITVGTVVNPEASDGVGYFPLQSIRVGNNIISSSTPAALGTNWTGSISEGFTHETGAAGDIVLAVALTENKRYVMIFDVTSQQEEALMVSFGDGVAVDVYNSATRKYVGFISDGVDTITISAIAALGTTITNISLHEVVQSGGTELEFEARNVDHGNTAANISGYWNVAIGDYTTMSGNVSGSRNVAIGMMAENRLQQGTRNVAVGTFAMAFVKEGERNVAIGADSLYSGSNTNKPNQAIDNVAIGKAAMHDGPMIQRNVAIGSRAMKDGSGEATDNTVVGFQAGNYAHDYNTFIGKRAGYYTKGNHNTALGWEAGADLYVTGARNISIGSQAGFDNTGASAAAIKTIDNAIAIGYGVKAKASNQAWFARPDQTVFLAGKKINFNQGGSVTWEDPA